MKPFAIVGLTVCLNLAAQGAGPGGHGGGPGGPGGPGGSMGGPMGEPGGVAAGPMNGGGDPFLKILKRLDLTGVQRKNVEEILDKHQDDADSLHQDIFEKERAFLKAAFDMNTKDAKLKELSAALEEAKLKAILDARATMQEIMAVLTVEQREKAKKLLSRRMPFEGLGPMGPGEMPPPPPPPMGGLDCRE